MKNVLLRTGYFSIIVSIAICIIGVLLIWIGEQSVIFISYILSGILAIWGIVNIIKYFTTVNSKNLFNIDFEKGVFLILIAVFIFLCIDMLLPTFRVIIGLGIMFSGIMNINKLFKFQRTKLWRTALFISILIIACGTYILMFDSILISTIGVLLIAYSLMNAFEAGIYIRNVNKMIE